MALKVNGTIVVDNTNNVTNVEGYFGNGVADQSEAIAGLNNSKIMTPSRVKESIEANAVVKVGGSSGAAEIPGGSEASRPTPTVGMLRFNSVQSKMEYYNGTQWKVLATGDVNQDPRGWFGHTPTP